VTSAAPLASAGATIATIVAAMAVVSVLELVVPLRARGRWHRAHLAPNLLLTALAFATNLVLSVGLVAVLAAEEARGLGLLGIVALPAPAAGALVLLVLDLGFYAAHVAMHKVPALWHFHRVHHCDPAVDVTTTIRQHPGESVIRYAFTAAFACALGASPAAFAVYRSWSALNGLLEHANVRVPLALDAALALVVSTPNMHKVHHSRLAAETDTNYGNVFALFDRLFATFTPTRRGVGVVYGLDGLDDPAAQTTAALLALPFRAPAPSRGGAPAPAARTLSCRG
jgi:sterol desaturase/sphingolipid hydroxylase (fatty acid hydroxylase superfamily)